MHARTRLGRTPCRLLGVIVLTLMLLLPATAQAAPKTDVSGTSNGVELTARWWQVALFPGDLSFFFDTDPGANCREVNLPSGTLVMAAGTLGGDAAPRTCSVPAGATVVLPAINTIYALTEAPPADTIGLARQFNREFIDAATASATVDGAPVRLRRIRSSAFWVNGAVFGFGDTLKSASDGYWLVWKAVPGTHEVTSQGAAAGFTSSTSYTFFVS